ncbi:MAG: carboxypeptidase regulatory-like domain-containing protein [Myxococcus sp.]|nr:carboxypeptidase regulatory-like domain-containing protein [Myxococcus sp.]
MTNRLIALSLAVLTACAPPVTDANKDGIADGVRTPNSVTQIAPSTPVGSITGVVVTTKFGPLADANVQLVLGAGFTSAIKSASDGAFRFASVPAGSSGQLIIWKDGFGSVRVPVTVPVSGGNVPVNDANANVGMVLLLELNGSVKYQVQTANGRPARAVRALLEVNPAGFQLVSGTGFGSPLGQLSFEGQADDTGTLTFMNVPAPAELARTTGGQPNYTLIISGLDEDGDGENEFSGLVDTRSGRDFFTNGVPTLRLADNRASGAPRIVATNVESLDGTLSPIRNMLKPNESVWVVFDQPINERSLLVRATQEDCSTVVNTSVVVKGNVLQITAAGNGWTLGDKHNLLVRVTGTEAGGSSQTSSFTGFVFGGDLAMPRAPMAAAFSIKRAPGNMGGNIANGDNLIITFDVPLKRVSTSGFFQWNFDLNMMGGVSPMDFGELGNSSGFPFTDDEPTLDPLTSQFSCLASGYTRRFTARITGLPVTGVPSGTQMRVVLPVVGSGQGGYQTVWGVPFTGQRDGTPTILP